MWLKKHLLSRGVPKESIDTFDLERLRLYAMDQKYLTEKEIDAGATVSSHNIALPTEASLGVAMDMDLRRVGEEQRLGKSPIQNATGNEEKPKEIVHAAAKCQQLRLKVPEDLRTAIHDVRDGTRWTNWVVFRYKTRSELELVATGQESYDYLFPWDENLCPWDPSESRGLLTNEDDVLYALIKSPCGMHIGFVCWLGSNVGPWKRSNVTRDKGDIDKLIGYVHHRFIGSEGAQQLKQQIHQVGSYDYFHHGIPDEYRNVYCGCLGAGWKFSILRNWRPSSIGEWRVLWHETDQSVQDQLLSPPPPPRDVSDEVVCVMLLVAPYNYATTVSLSLLTPMSELRSDILSALKQGSVVPGAATEAHMAVSFAGDEVDGELNLEELGIDQGGVLQVTIDEKAIKAASKTNGRFNLECLRQADYTCTWLWQWSALSPLNRLCFSDIGDGHKQEYLNKKKTFYSNVYELPQEIAPEALKQKAKMLTDAVSDEDLPQFSREELIRVARFAAMINIVDCGLYHELAQLTQAREGDINTADPSSSDDDGEYDEKCYYVYTTSLNNSAKVASELHQIKSILDLLKIPYEEVDVYKDALQGGTRRKEMAARSGSKDLPQIFVNDQYLEGGFEEFMWLNEIGEL